MADIHHPNPDVVVPITLTDADVEVLELLQERYGRDDATGILAHILTEYHERTTV